MGCLCKEGDKIKWKYNSKDHVTGWKALRGETIEVWQDPNGDQYVELNADKSSQGIEQMVQLKPGTYVLSWRHLGRNQGTADGSPYMVHVFAKPEKDKEGALGGTPIGTQPLPESNIYQPVTPTDYIPVKDWEQKFLVFSVTKELMDAKPNVWIAFDPTKTGTYGALIADVRLLPIEAKQPTINSNGTAGVLEVVESVRMCRWMSDRNTAGELADKEIFPSQDPDKLVIRLPINPKIKDAPAVAIHVSTTGGGAPYDDTGADVIFEEEGNGSGYYVSHSIAIVSSVEEDQFKIGPGTPMDNTDADLEGNVDGDLTFVGKPGGKIHLEGEDIAIPIDIPIKPFTHKITVKNLLVVKGIPGSDIYRLNEKKAQDSVEASMQRMKEIYGQIHVDVEVVTPDADKDVWRASLFEPAVNGTAGFDRDFEPKDSYYPKIVAAVRKRAPDNNIMKLLWLDPAYHKRQFVGDETLGRNMLNFRAPDIAMMFLNNIAPDADSIKQFAVTPSHETGHGLGLGFGQTGKGNHVNFNGTAYKSFELMVAETSGIIPDYPDKSATHWHQKDEAAVKAPENKALCPKVKP